MKIEGFFASTKTANEAVDKLKAMGFKDAIVDINEHYNEHRNVETNVPGTETSVSLSGLVLESDAQGISKEKAPLNAASPMVSGYGRFEEIADVNCKVIVNVGEGDAERVKKLIKDMGGDLESPNFRKPKLPDEQEFLVYKSLAETRDFINKEQKRP